MCASTSEGIFRTAGSVEGRAPRSRWTAGSRFAVARPTGKPRAPGRPGEWRSRREIAESRLALRVAATKDQVAADMREYLLSYFDPSASSG